MQWLILITSFLGKCDFINYHKCTMFANTVPWEQGTIYNKCGGRPIADEICWAGSSQCACKQGGAQEKCHGRLAVWDGNFQISSRYRRSFQERIGQSAEFVPTFSSTSPEHAVLLDTLCQHCKGFPRPTVFLTVLLLSASWYCGSPVLTSMQQKHRCLPWWWCPALCSAVLDGDGKPLGSSREWEAPGAGGTCPMLGSWDLLQHGRCWGQPRSESCGTSALEMGSSAKFTGCHQLTPGGLHGDMYLCTLGQPAVGSFLPGFLCP